MSKGQPAGVLTFKAATGGKDANSPREGGLAMLAILPKRERDKDLVRASVSRRFQGCQGCQHCLPRGVASLVASLPRTTAFMSQVLAAGWRCGWRAKQAAGPASRPSLISARLNF